MYPNLVPLILFCLATSGTPGPNNILASYSGFNFGIKKTIPLILGVIIGYNTMLISLDVGLIVIFKQYPVLQTVLKILGSFFLIYLAYKISFSKQSGEKTIENPLKFFDTFLFQFVNPKGVVVAIITISTFVETGANYLFHSVVVVCVSLFFAAFSITFWTLIGKFLRKFATNNKFIQMFNYAMSFLLILCVIMFYVEI